MSKSQLVQQEERQSIAPVVTDSSAIMAVIERAAQDPDTNVEKMERLFALYERMEDKRAESAFNAALVATQQEMRPIATNATNPQTRSKYATYDKLDGALRPIYTRNGFALSFDTADSPKPDHIRVVCYVSHEAGHSRTYKTDMPADGKGAKGGDVMTKTHAAGAAMSYGSRYLLKMIFNVAIGEDDKDGNGAGSPKVSDKQAADLSCMINEVLGDDTGAFYTWMRTTLKATNLSDLNQRGFDTAVEMLNRKKKGAK